MALKKSKHKHCKTTRSRNKKEIYCGKCAGDGKGHMQCERLKCSCKDSLVHISRIEGQLKTLKDYINEGKKCEDVAMLTTSIAKSFDSLRVKTLKNFLLNTILSDKKLSKKELESVDVILNLYKK